MPGEERRGFSVKTLFLLTCSIFLQSFSFLSIKLSTLQQGNMLYLCLGLAFMFLLTRAVVWQMLLKFEALSRIYPYSSLVQVLILLYAVLLFGEDVNRHDVAGLLIMLGGIYYISIEEND